VLPEATQSDDEDFKNNRLQSKSAIDRKRNIEFFYWKSIKKNHPPGN